MVSKQFLEERQTAIGGSDVLHLLALPPYGCTRRLWYDKSGTPPDFAQTENRNMRRGEAMQGFALTMYALQSGREIVELDPAWKLDESVSYFGVHADAIQKVQGERRLVEVKCPTARIWYAVRARPDPPNEANVQLQWGLMVHKIRHGTIVLFCADAWDERHWDVEGDDHMQSDLRAIGVSFWATLKKNDNPHPKLDPHDSRCKRCPWREACQGIADDEPAEDEAAVALAGDELIVVDPAQVQEAMLEYIACRQSRKDAEAQFAIAKARLEGVFPRPGRIVCDLGEVRLKEIRRRGYTTTVKETVYPSLTVKEKNPEVFSNDAEFDTL